MNVSSLPSGYLEGPVTTRTRESPRMTESTGPRLLPANSRCTQPGRPSKPFFSRAPHAGHQGLGSGPQMRNESQGQETGLRARLHPGATALSHSDSGSLFVTVLPAILHSKREGRWPPLTGGLSSVLSASLAQPPGPTGMPSCVCICVIPEKARERSRRMSTNTIRSAQTPCRRWSRTRRPRGATRVPERPA